MPVIKFSIEVPEGTPVSQARSVISDGLRNFQQYREDVEQYVKRDYYFMDAEDQVEKKKEVYERLVIARMAYSSLLIL